MARNDEPGCRLQPLHLGVVTSYTALGTSEGAGSVGHVMAGTRRTSGGVDKRQVVVTDQVVILDAVV